MRNLLMILFLSVSSSLLGEIIFVSDRLDFINPDEIAISTMKQKVILVPSYLSIPVEELSVTIEENQWIQAINNKEVAVLIHGYNNEYEDAVNFCFKIIQKCEHLYETFICYLWPGGNHALEYLEARSRAIGILPERLLSITNDLTTYAKHVDIIAHSMGCRLALEMMQYPSNIFIRNIFLMAPAVDNEALERGETYHNGSHRCHSMFIFHSTNDDVLKWAYPLGDFDRALGFAGSENTKDLPDHIFQVNCTNYIDSHGDYASSDFIFETIEDILDRPPIVSYR